MCTTIAHVTGELFCIRASLFALYDLTLLWLCDFVAVSFCWVMLTVFFCSLQDASLMVCFWQEMCFSELCTPFCSVGFLDELCIFCIFLTWWMISACSSKYQASCHMILMYKKELKTKTKKLEHTIYTKCVQKFKAP